MLSLSNAFEKKDMMDFIKNNNFLNLNSKKLEIFSEPKIDGISAPLIYENGILTHGLFREMEFTENILENIKLFQVFLKLLKEKISQN